MNRVFAYLSIPLVAGLISPIAVFSAASAQESEPAFFPCSSEQEVEEGVVADQTLASDPSSFTDIANTFNHTYWDYLFMYNGPTYFRIVTTDIEVIDLNYSGIDCSLRLYKTGHCSESDALMRIPNLNSSNQILILDAGATYFLALSTSIPGSHFFSIAPERVESSMANIGEYVIHLSSEQSNFFGSSISVERFQLSQTASVGTEPSILSRGLLSKAAELSDTLNFGYDINEDKRKVVANTGYSHYSAIARAQNSWYEYDGFNYAQNSSSFSGSFVTEDTVFTCSHPFLRKWDIDPDLNVKVFRSKLCVLDATFSPGASNYSLSSGQLWYSDYGQYAVRDVYIPLRRATLLHGSGVTYTIEDDWAICLTDNIYQGNFTHSTFGLSVPTFSSLSFAQCAGYPGLHNVPDNNPRIWMWDFSPSEQNIYSANSNSSYFQSDDMYMNGGSSGSPLFRSYSYIENGSLIRKAYQFGVEVANSKTDNDPPSEYDFTFDCSYFVKNTHFEMNLYHVLEGTGNEIEA